MKKKSTLKKKVSRRKSVAAKKKINKKDIIYALAPGGYRPEHLVKKAPASKKGRTAILNKLKKAPHSEAATQRLEIINRPKLFLEGLEFSAIRKLNPHWIAYAGWRNDSPVPVKRFTASVVVPPAPQKKNQVIYIFIGMENQQRILQPVLQWGTSKMGGGQFWSIGTVLAGTQSEQPYYLHDMVPVLAGERLTAVIELTQRTASGCSYNCFFAGKNVTLLPISAIPELKISWATMESYRVENRNEYPPSASVVFTDINVIDINNQLIIPPWNIPDQTGPFGEHATLTRTPEQPDRINLFF
jgi:hypothetical protein